MRARVGMVFQRPNPFPTMSVRDNVAVGPRLMGRSRSEVNDVVEWALSAGRRPIKRPLPSQRCVRIVRHLRNGKTPIKAALPKISGEKPVAARTHQ